MMPGAIIYVERNPLHGLAVAIYLEALYRGYLVIGVDREFWLRFINVDYVHTLVRRKP